MLIGKVKYPQMTVLALCYTCVLVTKVQIPVCVHVHGLPALMKQESHHKCMGEPDLCSISAEGHHGMVGVDKQVG